MPRSTDLLVRDASPQDAVALTDLAVRSKASWGYDDTFLTAFRRRYPITAARLQREVVRVAEQGGEIIGFSSLIVEGATATLEDLWVEPTRIGTGVGRVLWEEALALARGRGATRLRLEADPNSETWYRRRGAVRVGVVASEIMTGREIPVMEIGLG